MRKLSSFIVIFFSVVLTASSQDALVMRIIYAAGNVTVDEERVTSGRKVYSSSNEMKVAPDGMAYVLTEAGYAYRFAEGRYLVDSIDHIIVGKKGKAARSLPVHIASHERLRLTFDVSFESNYLFGDSIFVVVRQVNQAGEGKDVPKLPLRIKFLTIFDDDLYETVSESYYIGLKVPAELNADKTIVIEISNPEFSSERFVIRKLTSEKHETIQHLLDEYSEETALEKELIAAALFELEELMYDHVWRIYKLTQMQKQIGVVPHLYYQRQAAALGIPEF
jgi:hypothetical protein